MAFTDFLAPAECDALLADLRREGVRSGAWGGYPAARLRVVAAWPPEVPVATAPLAGLHFGGAVTPEAVRGALVAAGVAPGRLGDAVVHQDGVTAVTLAPVPSSVVGELVLGGVPTHGREVPLEHVTSGTARELSAVVSSLRVDALGARAFGVSRAYFAKGVAAGRVLLNGRPAGKSASVSVGDEVYADGLGRFSVAALVGATRRGNQKVTLLVERS